MRIALLTLLILSIYGSTNGQTRSARHYQVESGLSNNAIMCSVQDIQGFMWFGTRDGLNRFDGNKFKVYNFKENNFIHAITVNKRGELFVATEKSIYRYDRKTDSFLIFISPDYFSIDELLADHDGNLWFTASATLYCYRISDRKLIRPAIWNKDYITSICLDENGTLWIGTSNGKLKEYDKRTQNFKAYDLFISLRKSESHLIEAIKSANDIILVGTFQRGVGIFDKKTKTYRDIDLGTEDRKNLMVSCFLQSSPDEVWIGTETGIYLYNFLTRKSSNIRKNSGDRYSLSDDVIYSLLKDREGGIWVGTYFGGLNYFPAQYTPFKKYNLHSLPYPLSGDIVRDITEDKYGNIWLCTEDGGVNQISSKTGKIYHLRPDGTKNSFSYKSAHGILAVGNEIWAGTYEHGLNIIDIKTQKVIRHYYATSKKGLASNFPFCIYKRRSGEVLVGTDNGLYVYNYATDFFTRVKGFPSSGLYNSIIEDGDGSLWASISGNGLFKMDRKTKQLSHFKFDPNNSRSLISDKITSLFKDSDNNIWIATEFGLCKWNAKASNFNRFGSQNGFPSNFILSILEDKNKILWISTTKGLISFDPNNNKTVVYTTANGLLSDQFNFDSAYKASDGKLYFGSAVGLIAFNPMSFRKDTFIPDVYITDLTITGEGSAPGHSRNLNISNALFKKNLILTHNQSSLDIEFSALGYTSPQGIRYAYKLTGLSEKWNYVTKINKLNFPKLSPGNYVFKIMASSTSGLWNGNITKLAITVLPPWWESRLANLLYISSALAMSFFLIEIYHYRIQQKNLRHLERMDIAKEKSILEAKIDFYTEVAHEIRTPLTLIKIPLEKVVRNTLGINSITRSLKIIRGNTDRLIELSNQLLDFRKTELKSLSFDFKIIDVGQFIKDICENFSELVDQNKIYLQTGFPPEPVNIMTDSESLKKIIYNLVSNAIKYADGIVILTLSSNINDIVVSFKNDGKMIPLALQEKIFEPFFRVWEGDGKTGSGIGLALARSLAESLGGKLEFWNDNDQMNVFLLTLPYKHI